MIYYLIFALCAFYEDIRSVFDKIKGLDVNKDPIEVKFLENLDMSINYNGRLTELIYILGVLIGAMFAPEKLFFIAILLISLIPKKNLSWIIIDTIISICLITFILFSHYLHY